MFADKDISTLNKLKIIDYGFVEEVKAKKYFYSHVGTPGYVAPEILKNRETTHTYTEKCDIFSIGVIMHIMLTGQNVFSAKKFGDIVSLNTKCKINYSDEKYKSINEVTLDLLQQLLQPDPLHRPSANEALEHPFFDVNNLKVEQNQGQSANELENQIRSPPKMLEGMKQNLQLSLNMPQQQNNKSNQQLDKQQLKQAITYLNQPIQNADQAQKDMLYHITRMLFSYINQISMKNNIIFQQYVEDRSPQKQKEQVKKFFDFQLNELGNLEFAEDYVDEECKVEIPQDKKRKPSKFDYNEAEIQQEEVNSEQQQKQENLIQINQDSQKIAGDDMSENLLPKNFLLLMEYFPEDVLNDFLGSISIEQMKENVRKLGSFLLFGNMKEQDNFPHLILRRIQFVEKYKIFDPWFIDLIKMMLESDIDKRYNILEVKEVLDKNAKFK